jgi:hypothetical protein
MLAASRSVALPLVAWGMNTEYRVKMDDDEKIFSGYGGGGSVTAAKRGNKYGRRPGIPNRNTTTHVDYPAA